MAYGSILGQTPIARTVSYDNSLVSSLISSDNVQGALDEVASKVGELSSGVVKSKLVLDSYLINSNEEVNVSFDIPEEAKNIIGVIFSLNGQITNIKNNSSSTQFIRIYVADISMFSFQISNYETINKISVNTFSTIFTNLMNSQANSEVVLRLGTTWLNGPTTSSTELNFPESTDTRLTNFRFPVYVEANDRYIDATPNILLNAYLLYI